MIKIVIRQNVIIEGMHLKYFVYALLFFVYLANSSVYANETPSKASILLTEKERIWLDSHPKIKLGATTSYPPIVIKNADGKYTGVFIDIFKLINQRLNTDIQIHSEDSWVTTQQKANNKILDGLAVGAITPEREENFIQTNSIFPTYFYVFARSKEEFMLKQPEDLIGLRVGYRRGSLGIKTFLEKYPGIISVPYDDNISISKALLSKEVDVLVAWISFNYWIRESLQGAIENVLIIDQYPIDMVSHVRKDWPEFASIMNKAISSVHTDGLKQILDKWFISKPPYSTKLQLELTQEEKNWLSDHPVIRYGFDPYWAPVEYTTDNITHEGISAEYLNKIERLLNIKFEAVPTSTWGKAVKMLSINNLDLLPAAAKTKNRQMSMVFTEPYLSMPITIFSATDMAYVGGIKDLYGKKVAVVNKYAIHEWLKRDHPDLELMPVANIGEGLKLITKGEAFSFVGNLATTSYYIGKNSNLNIRVVGETPYTNELSMAVRKDWPILVGILQKALNAIPESSKNKIHHDWMSIRYEHGFDYVLMWKILAIIATIILVFVFWNMKLRKEILKRKIVESQLLNAKHEAEKAKHEAEKAKHEAEKANKAKSTFLSSMSHELRTPMNAILGFSQLIDLDSEDSQVKDNSREIIDAGKYLLELINQLLDLSKIESGAVSLLINTYKLNDLLNECLSTIRPIADNNLITVNSMISASVNPKISVDKIRFKQIILNLLSNAIKYNSSQGEVTIHTSVVDEHTIKVSISDTGKGLTSQQLDHLFTPYDRAGLESSEVEGTGLGLVISKELIELMKGSIGVESKPERGSTFWVQMPITI